MEDENRVSPAERWAECRIREAVAGRFGDLAYYDWWRFKFRLADGTYPFLYVVADTATGRVLHTLVTQDPPSADVASKVIGGYVGRYGRPCAVSVDYGYEVSGRGLREALETMDIRLVRRSCLMKGRVERLCGRFIGALLWTKGADMADLGRKIERVIAAVNRHAGHRDGPSGTDAHRPLEGYEDVVERLLGEAW
jgi:hypothetical protein